MIQDIIINLTSTLLLALGKRAAGIVLLKKDRRLARCLMATYSIIDRLDSRLHHLDMVLAMQMLVIDGVLPDHLITRIQPTVASDSLIEVAFCDKSYHHRFPLRYDKSIQREVRLQVRHIKLDNEGEGCHKENTKESSYDCSSIEQWPWEVDEITADLKGYVGVTTQSAGGKSVPYFHFDKKGRIIKKTFSDFVVILIDHCASKVYSEMQTLALSMAEIFAIMRQGMVLEIKDPDLRELCLNAAIVDAHFVEFSFEGHRSTISVDLKSGLIKYEYTRGEFQADQVKYLVQDLKKYSSSSWYKKEVVKYSLNSKSDVQEFHHIICDMRCLLSRLKEHLQVFLHDNFELADLL